MVEETGAWRRGYGLGRAGGGSECVNGGCVSVSSGLAKSQEAVSLFRCRHLAWVYFESQCFGILSFDRPRDAGH